MYRNPIPCAGVAVVDGYEVLLVKRGVPPDEGKWGVPGGHLEYDETPAEAAVRELTEETDIRVPVDALTLVDTVTYEHSTGKRTVSIGYAARRCDTTVSEIRSGTDATDARFWNPHDLANASDEYLRAHDVERVHEAIRIVNE